MKKYVFGTGAIIWGIFFFGFLMGLIFSLNDLKFPNAIPGLCMMTVCGIGMGINLFLWIRCKHKTNNKPNSNSLPKSAPTITPQNPISSQAIKNYTPINSQIPTTTPTVTPVSQSKPAKKQKTIAERNEDSFDLEDKDGVIAFIVEHEKESKQRCDKFFELDKLAGKEKDINKEIEMLKEAISAYEDARQWHYGQSKGGGIYFSEMWEETYSEDDSQIWINLVKKNLKSCIKIRDEVIPWIIENSKKGFRQPDIYQAFPTFHQSSLRHIIDNLAEKSIITKTKKSDSFYISCGSAEMTDIPPQPTPQKTPTNTQPNSNQNAPIRISQTVAVGNITPESVFSHLPEGIVHLLWFLNGPLQNYSGESDELNFDFAGHSIHIKTSIRNEPSAIDVNLPLSDTPAASEPLGYYPSYKGLTPRQRTDYFKWLADITAPTDIGFVFLFYYGLERHLLFGDSINAFATILTLRQFHKNNSFLNYSGDAIVLYSLINSRWDVLQNLDVEQLSVDLHLLVAVLINKSLSAKDIMRTYKKFGFDNNRYIKNESELFQSTLESNLINKYNFINFPVSDEDLVLAKGNIQLVLANYSLLPEQRFFELPDIATSPRVHDEINALLMNTHEAVKVKLREQRKKQT